MKFETLKTINKKKLIIGTTIISCLIIVVTIYVSHAKFISTDSITIMDGEINYTPYDLQMIGMYQQKEGCTDTSDNNCYQETNKMPSTGYEINESKSYCYVDDENKHETGITLRTNSAGEHIIGGLSKRSKCVIYFVKAKTASEKTFDQLAKLGSLTSKGEMTTFTSTCASADCNGIYTAQDDDGISYYFRGIVENNYVKFGKMGSTTNGADIWWRIIRINGDGSIRMIFAGTSTNGSAPAQTGAGTAIDDGKRYQFGSYTKAEYAGYQYTEGQKKGHTDDSSAKTEIDAWFLANLNDEFTASNSKIDRNAGFCGDRSTYNPSSPYAANASLGTEYDEVYFGAYIRNAKPNGKDVSSSNPAQPSFKCPDKANDLYTYTGSTQGTRSLDYPIGMITADEVVYAGGASRSNSGYYLYNGAYYWNISPSKHTGWVPEMYVVSSTGSSTDEDARGSYVIRPVLNLKSGALNSGTGISNDPYKIS